MTGDVNTAAPHPDESQLRGLLQGTLPSADEAAVLALLEREPAWQAALDRLVADETTWRAAAQSLARPPLAADPMLRSVLASLGSIERSHSSINTPSSGETVDSAAGEESSDNRDLHFLSPSEDPAYLGKLGPYLVEEVLGRGGFGLVLKARDPKLARVVAIKVLAPHLAASGTACQRFRREALSAAAVAHEHVITIFAVDDQPLPHLVMQFVAGQSLQDKLDREGPLGIKQALRIGMQTAAGLAAAHKQGLVHRDIKPANILLENGIERVKLTDFGLARAADDASLTRSGTIAGTPQYMSPEQARGETVDARSDLFSLGTVLYAMLTGHSPFRADSTLAVLKRVCDDPPRPIREVNPEVPDWLAVLITRLLAKNPDDRPDSAQEIADQLGYYLAQIQQPGVVAPRPFAQRPVARPAASITESTIAPTDAISDNVRKQIDRLAHAHLLMIGLSTIGFVAALIGFANTYRGRGAEMAFATTCVVAMWVLGLSLPVPLITALLTLRRASYGVLMTGTVLTLVTAGFFNLFCWPISMGIAIWVLVQLQRDDIRAALARGFGSRVPRPPSTASRPAAVMESLSRQSEAAPIAKGKTPALLDLTEARRFVQPIGCALLAVAAFQLAAVPALYGWLHLISPTHPPQELVELTVYLMWTLALSSLAPVVGGILSLRLESYRAAVGCAWISLLLALVNIPCWPVTVGLAAWALWWLRKRESRDAFALAEPRRLTADEQLDPRWIRHQIRPIGYAFLAVAALCWLGMIGLVGFWFRIGPARPSQEAFLLIVCLFWLLGAFSIVPLGAGILALRRGSYHAVAGGAWLSLLPALANIPCWPLSVGIAIWLVRQLWRNEVREAFSHAPPHNQHTSLVTGDAPMLAKPAKYDPFADAPPTPTRSRAASALLGLAALLGGLLLLGCLGAVGSYFLSSGGDARSIIEDSRQLIVNIPDRRLNATLRLVRANYLGGFPIPGVAIQDPNYTLQIASGDSYRLIAGDYELTVKSDDVIVFSDSVHIQPDAIQPKVYEVKPGGLLNIEAQSDGTFMSVELNGRAIMDNVQGRSQRTLVVPEGTIRLKSCFGSLVYAEKWLELKAGEELRVRVSQQSIAEVTTAATKSGH